MKKTSLLALWMVGLISCGGNERPIRAPGVVDGEIASIRVLAAGTLDRLLVREGQAVGKGDRVAEMNRDKVRNRQEELALMERDVANSETRAREKRRLLQANAGYWQEQVERFERLKQSRSISGDQLEKSRLRRKEAQTALFDLDRSLEALQIQKERVANQRQALDLAEKDLLLQSPVSGVVLETFVGQGETVLPGTALADILDLSSLFVDVFIEEKEIATLKIGQQADIFVDGMRSRAFSGRIAFFGRKAEFSPKYIVAEKERQALLYQVKIRIEKDLDVFKVGMPVTVVFSR